MPKKCLILTLLILGFTFQISFAESVTINSSLDDKDGNPLTLPAILKKPNGKGPFPAVVLLAGCSGEWFNSIRESTWAELLVSWGYVTIQPDSWNPRNDSGVCTQSEYYRIPSMAIERAQDAFDAKAFLAIQPYIDPNRIAIMGWSHGGWTVLKALRTELIYKNTQGPFRVGIAFYPYCTKPLDKLNAPLKILHGEKDNWTPAYTCTAEMPSGKTEHEVVHHIYPDAYHAFDWPGLDETYEGQRLVYNPEATKKAIGHVKGFLEKHL